MTKILKKQHDGPIPTMSPWRMRLWWGNIMVDDAEGVDGIKRMCHRIMRRLERGSPPGKLERHVEYGAVKEFARKAGVDYDALRAWISHHRRGSRRHHTLLPEADLTDTPEF